ncbi:SMP-30/gluconolactonase/LRE family protein [Gilvimarinus agarilyticus]|uniref:SMP-30/gluconolactonase/LRE family protein n=1 Tax=Gilvimarinus agarilyticus TaxID=679259 RepID=UPI00059F3F65|nr:SMP-30/gluconolactonase/LRE family protein [Gilvimarinus agarilyticus]
MKKITGTLTLVLAVSACTQPSASDTVSSSAVRADRYCSSEHYRSPTGELSAERIVAANFNEPGLYEGPVWRDGRLLFSRFGFGQGFPSNIMSYDGQDVSVLLNDAGTNGLALDNQGQLLAGTHKFKAVARYSLSTGEHDVVADKYREHVFNSPNDLTMSARGDIYFTDPDFQRAAAPGGQDVTRVYRVDPQGQVSVVDETIANPNGISLSPDEKTLYVAGGGAEGFVRAYPLQEGAPGPGKTLLTDVSVPDGMAVDCLGNIYVTEHTNRRVRVVSPEGDEIAIINVDANVTNGAFGGDDGKTLYLTGAGALWSVQLDVAGLPY